MLVLKNIRNRTLYFCKVYVVLYTELTDRQRLAVSVKIGSRDSGAAALIACVVLVYQLSLGSPAVAANSYYRKHGLRRTDDIGLSGLIRGMGAMADSSGLGLSIRTRQRKALEDIRAHKVAWTGTKGQKRVDGGDIDLLFMTFIEHQLEVMDKGWISPLSYVTKKGT